MADRPDDLAWMNERQMLGICGIPRSSFQSWGRVGVVEPSPDGTYGEGAVIEVAFVALLREHWAMEDVRAAWRDLQRTGQAAEVVDRVRTLADDARLDLVLEVDHAAVHVEGDDASLVEAVRHAEAPRAVKVVPAAERLRLVRDAFRRKRNNEPRPATRRPGRPRRQAELRSLREEA